MPNTAATAAAVKAAVEAAEKKAEEAACAELMIGQHVRKEFEDGAFDGVVQSVDMTEHPIFYKVLYTDGDREDMVLEAVQKHAVNVWDQWSSGTSGTSGTGAGVTTGTTCSSSARQPFSLGCGRADV